MNPRFTILIALAVFVAGVTTGWLLHTQRHGAVARAEQKAKADPHSRTKTIVDQKVLDWIAQVDATNIAIARERFYQNHPEVKRRPIPVDISDQGIPREFDQAILHSDVSALSKICEQISADTNSSVSIRTITDRPQVCGIVHVERLGDTSETSEGGARRSIRIYQYEMTDSKQNNSGFRNYLAVSWIYKSGAWALESAISSGSFFCIEKKP